MQNTLFEFLHRDSENHNSFSAAVLAGEMSDADFEAILDCAEDEDSFIPAQVGLHDERFPFDADVSQPWCELYNYRLVPGSVKTCGISVEELVRRFRAAKGHWTTEQKLA